ncbi:hypothetical protein HN51_067214 [Arachis hypogaea]|uniref:Uncharacterized protein n=1 Tax=Arachis hypogaea TaxID=3818 RepID=A0A444ZM97_ARAHY|nr:hypothetical protein Ahy_B04g072060 [Arachis hypogaea]
MTSRSRWNRNLLLCSNLQPSFHPIVRKFTGQRSGITFGQRIRASLVLSVLNMVVSSFVETKRIGVCIQHNLIENPKAYVPISIWWLLPHYVISDTSDALTVIEFQEFYYNQMPEGMRSLGAATLYVVFGLRSFVNDGIIVCCSCNQLKIWG